MTIVLRGIFVLTIAALLAMSAYDANARIPTGRGDLIDVPPVYRAVASEYNHPAAIVYSIALAESGNDYHGARLPWPWAVNHGGTPLYFDTREEAYNYLAPLVASGQCNFDVGLMQVNWCWHKDRFSSLWDALDPVTNIRAGASILREEYNRLGSYEAAVGAYHSRTAHRANAYRERVRKILTRLVLAERRGQ